jgi:hypothetical protein
MKYCITDEGGLSGEFEADNGQAAKGEALRWLAGAVEDKNFLGEWLLAEGDEAEWGAGFCRLDDDDEPIEVKVKIRNVGGVVVVVN